MSNDQNIIESWDPVDDSELALMFEDDIEVSREYFDYILSSLVRHVYSGKNGERNKDGHLAKSFIGISLTTPRYDETSIPRKFWTPQAEIGDEPFFIFQLACSWGALYFPWAWREYITYYRWRKNLELPGKVDVIPFSYVNIWERSWKRYLQELMFIRGKFMLYPNMKDQGSFSTHHRELGEHTQGKPEVPLVDLIGTNNKPILTVPLLVSSPHLDMVLKRMKPLEALPVINFYHNRTRDVYDLGELGIQSAELLREFGFSIPYYNRNPNCVLDWSRPVTIKKTKSKYVSYIPQGDNLLYQLEQLRSAIAIAYILKRTLIVPDFRAGNGTVQSDNILDLSFLANNGFVKLQKISKVHSKPRADRLIAFHPFDWLGRKPLPPAIDVSDMVMFDDTARHIMLPLQQGTDYDIFRWFNGCNDQLLLFTRLDNAFSQFVDLELNDLFEHFIWNSIRPSKELSQSLEIIRRSLGRVICIEHFLPHPVHCSRPKYEGRYWRAIQHQNCNRTVEEVVAYAHSWTSHLKMDIDSIYVLHDFETNPHLNIPIVYRSENKDIVTAIYSAKDLIARTPYGVSIALIEEELCGQAPFYLGNAFSFRSQRMAKKRSRLLTALLGMGIIRPYRNETLPLF